MNLDFPNSCAKVKLNMTRAKEMKFILRTGEAIMNDKG
jgi:hypothetical protein